MDKYFDILDKHDNLNVYFRNEEYGKWHAVYMKFSRWSKNGTIAKATASFL